MGDDVIALFLQLSVVFIIFLASASAPGLMGMSLLVACFMRIKIHCHSGNRGCSTL